MPAVLSATCRTLYYPSLPVLAACWCRTSCAAASAPLCNQVCNLLGSDSPSASGLQAFSATGTMEAAWFKATGQQVGTHTAAGAP